MASFYKKLQLILYGAGVGACITYPGYNQKLPPSTNRPLTEKSNKHIKRETISHVLYDSCNNNYISDKSDIGVTEPDDKGSYMGNLIVIIVAVGFHKIINNY